MIDLIYEFVGDFFYWKQPEKTIMLLKEAIKLPILLLFCLYFLSLRYFLVLGIWVAALSNSSFSVSVFQITT